MIRTEAVEEGSAGRVESGDGRRWKVLGLAVAAALVSCWVVSASTTRRPYTCAACRADRLDRSCMGLRWSQQGETDCSRWYAANVEPIHEHAWVACTHCQAFGIPGLYGGVGCFIGGPITMLSRTRQVEIYEHFGDRLEAKRLFIRMGQRDGDPQGTLTSLLDWSGEGYPGTWEQWRRSHPASAGE